MGSFDDNIPLTRIVPTKPWDRNLPQRNPQGKQPVPRPEPASKSDTEQSDPGTGDGHIDEYA